MQAQEILLKAKKNVFTRKTADSLSKMRGDGLDFCEIRPYQAGDDVRKINFNASSRMNELQTNVFNENRQINVVIAVVLSSSLHFGSVRLKNSLMAEIIANLGYSSMQQKNQTKVVFFSGLEQKIFSINHTGDLFLAIEYMLQVNLLKITTDFKVLNDYLIQQKKSLVFVLSDFYQPFDGVLIANKNQINALIVRDHLEEFPNLNAALHLINAQNNSSIELNLDKKLAQKYQTKLKKQDQKLHSHFLQYKINFGIIYTADDTFTKLSQILK